MDCKLNSSVYFRSYTFSCSHLVFYNDDSASIDRNNRNLICTYHNIPGTAILHFEIMLTVLIWLCVTNTLAGQGKVDVDIIFTYIYYLSTRFSKERLSQI